MNRNILRFTILLSIFPAVAGLIATKWPEWLIALLFNEDSDFYRFLREGFLPDVAIVCFAIVFFWQIIGVVRWINVAVISTIFHAHLMFLRKRILLGSLMLGSVMVASLLIGLALQGFLSYGAYLYKAFDHHREINRQLMITHANEVEKKEGSEAALPEYKRILTVYPGDDRNEGIDNKITQTQDVLRLSNQLLIKGQSYEERENMSLASEFYKASIAVYTYNRSSRQRLDSLEERFSHDTPQLQSFYDLCRQRDLNAIVKNAQAFVFAVKDISALSVVPNLKTDAARTRALEQVCGEAFKNKTSDAFVSSLKKDLFVERVNKWPEDD